MKTITIFRRDGSVLAKTDKPTMREAVESCKENLREADLRGADLRGADLWGADLRATNLEGADLRGADLEGAVFSDRSGRSTKTRIKNSQVNDFLTALGVIVED